MCFFENVIKNIYKCRFWEILIVGRILGIRYNL